LEVAHSVLCDAVAGARAADSVNTAQACHAYCSTYDAALASLLDVSVRDVSGGLVLCHIRYALLVVARFSRAAVLALQATVRASFACHALRNAAVAIVLALVRIIASVATAALLLGATFVSGVAVTGVAIDVTVALLAEPDTGTP